MRQAFAQSHGYLWFLPYRRGSVRAADLGRDGYGLWIDAADFVPGAAELHLVAFDDPPLGLFSLARLSNKIYESRIVYGPELFKYHRIRARPCSSADM